ncbi:MAG TPA: hypothetical protein DIS82_00040 [Exiguobacterium sp.]|nr:hypothetical protein [Exiguobacterium sp.]
MFFHLISKVIFIKCKEKKQNRQILMRPHIINMGNDGKVKLFIKIFRILNINRYFTRNIRLETLQSGNIPL